MKSLIFALVFLLSIGLVPSPIQADVWQCGPVYTTVDPMSSACRQLDNPVVLTSDGSRMFSRTVSAGDDVYSGPRARFVSFNKLSMDGYLAGWESHLARLRELRPKSAYEARRERELEANLPFSIPAAANLEDLNNLTDIVDCLLGGGNASECNLLNLGGMISGTFMQVGNALAGY